MKTTKIEKVALMTIVKENLAKHINEFDEAVVDYKAAVLKLSKNNLKLATTGDLKKIGKIESIPSEPRSYESEYNRAIRKLELSVDTVIEVDELTFNQLVLDEWTWKNLFSTSNAIYKTMI